MKKLMMSLLLIGVLPFTVMAQDDDMYFVPSKESKAKDVYNYGLPSGTYYSGSSRSVDDYNRRMIGAIPSDSVGNDIIDFSAVRGVYPDSTDQTVKSEDYQLTRRMTRFDDYTPSQAYWDGYRDGRWASPWYYNSYYSWYTYDPWYWNDPYYYGWYNSWYYGWNSPWYYGYYHRPWHYGYGYYGPTWYAGRAVRTTPHRGRYTTYRNDGRSFGRTNNSRTTYNDNRSFGNRTSSPSSSSFGSSRSSGGGFGGGGGSFGGGGGARTSSGGRSFGGRR